MSTNQPFYPHYGTGQNVTANSTSASVAISRGTNQIRIINTGSNPGQIRIGRGAQTAAAADLHLVPGAIEVITKGFDDDTLAYRSELGTTFNIMTGEGW